MMRKTIGLSLLSLLLSNAAFADSYCAKGVDDMVNELDYANMKLRLETYLDKCARTVLVTHSQGNFYGNRLYTEVSNNYVYPNVVELSEYPMLGYMGIANPTFSHGGPQGVNNPEIAKTFTNSNDLPMAGVRIAFGAIAANPVSASLAFDFSGHGLKDSYLQDNAAPYIADLMKEIIDNLTPYPMFEQHPSSSSAISHIGHSYVSNILDKTKIQRLKRQAKLRVDAQPSQLIYKEGRNLNRKQMSELLTGSYLHKHQNILITGPTGAGKTYLGCALASSACDQQQTVRDYRLTRLLDDLTAGRLDGSYQKQLQSLAKKALLIPDDWGMEKLTQEHADHLLEVLEDRYQNSSTIVISQLPVKEWYNMIGNATVADALMDRLVHNSHRIELGGESMRKLAQSDHLE